MKYNGKNKEAARKQIQLINESRAQQKSIGDFSTVAEFITYSRKLAEERAAQIHALEMLAR